RVLDAALDAVAPADIDIVVHAHRRHRQLQRGRDLLRIARHLDRGPDIEHLAPGIPAHHDAKGLDGYRGTAAPLEAQRQALRAFGKIALDVAPDKAAVEQHV